MDNNAGNSYEQFIAKITAETKEGIIRWNIDSQNYPFISGSSLLIKQFTCSLGEFDLLLANLKDQIEVDGYNMPYEETRIIVVVIKDGIPAQFIDKRSVNEEFLWKLDACVTQSTTQVQAFISSYIR